MGRTWKFDPDAIVVQTLRLLNVGLGAFLLWTAYQEAALYAGTSREWVVNADLIAGGLLLALGALAFWRLPAARWGHPWALLTVVVATATAGVTLALVRDGSNASNLGLVLMGAGMVFLSAAWFAVAVGLVLAVWIGLTRMLPVTEVGAGDFTVQISFIIAVAVFLIRRHAHRWLVTLADDLQVARQHATRSQQDLDTFATTISQDLQAPLTALRMHMSSVRAALRKDDRDRAERSIEAMEQISVETAEFIQALLKYSRYGNDSPEAADVDLEAVLRDVSHYVHEAVSATGGTIHIEALPKARADIVHMHQLFTLLFANAVHHRRPGTPVRIAVRGALEGHRCRIVVEDDGKGFDSVDLDQLFTPFAHGRREQRLGHGLGLATCQRIVESNGGTIHAEPRDHGARFVICLPAAEQAGLEAERPPGLATPIPRVQ